MKWFAEKDFSELNMKKLGFWPGVSAGIVATDGVIFAGDLAGQIEAYDAISGNTLWSYASARTFTTVNNLESKGGSIDSHGPLPVDDLLLVSSGYSGVGMKGGNAFLVFQLDEESDDELMEEQ
jgi:polyvinyl alcohol dehydrogenase (cytochrome)